MLTAIKLKLASSRGKAPLSFSLQPSVTIFVGPNNSEKSLLLREINALCKDGSNGPHTRILDTLQFEGVDEQTAQIDLKKIQRAISPGEALQPGQSSIWLNGGHSVVDNQTYLIGRKQPNQHLSLYAYYYLSGLTLWLDGATRIGLLNQVPPGDLKAPVAPLAKIFMNDPMRTKWRTEVHNAFELYPAIDATVGNILSVRFGSTPPSKERSFEEENIDWMKAARPLEEVSDGVKAFSGILLQVFAGDPKVILIDEPEAFLHPSLARTLGKSLATAAHSEDKFVFVSTHSSEFVMGAIQSGAVVNIVRLTHDAGVGTARLLPNDDLVQMMNDPMLRSVGVLSGLFFNNVVVTEGDTDRAFYQEVNERLLAAGDPRAIPHALFLNADNKDTIPAIVGPLRKLGIPAVGVFDLDVVREGKTKWTRLLEGSGLPSGQHEASHKLRQNVLENLVKAAPKEAAKPEIYFKRNGGIELLKGDQREAANNFCDDLEKYGSFIVRKGEVESWLKHLSLPSKDGGWRAAIFGAMGSDPKKEPYVYPAKGDVWDFVGSIKKWLTDPTRKGIPQ
ncbi:MAG: ATP-binding protein [Proteobacteria bacterium]|nr:ATP-binding protein [Pseudomonadota bacterium]